MRLRANRSGFAIAAAVALASCSAVSVDGPRPAARSIVNGPAADYPVVLGDPFLVEGTTYEPVDVMNYDMVGYAALDTEGGSGVTVAHKTLPMPSYVEIASLDTGRTIIARVERRGPMVNDRLVALSPGAATQLSIGERAPVRVRRVNPLEEHRALLRSGAEAPLRMNTPSGLVELLRRRLPESGSASLSDARQELVSGRVPDGSIDALALPVKEIPPIANPRPDPAPAAPVMPTKEQVRQSQSIEPAAKQVSQNAANGKHVIQLGAFGVRANADRLAAKIDGHVVVSGKFALVRVGPFANRGQAEAALAKLRGQGYSDARITTLK